MKDPKFATLQAILQSAAKGQSAPTVKKVSLDGCLSSSRIVGPFR